MFSLTCQWLLSKAFSPSKSLCADIESFPLIDGTYLVSNGLSFTHTNYTANVPVIVGTARDESAITVPYPASPNITLAFETISTLLGLDLSWVPSSSLFPLATTSSDPTINIFNLTAHVLTLGGFRCLTQATAYSATLHRTFPSVYSYIFNRTYQTPSFSSPPCVPPSTSQFPSGDPEKEYFKCHAGEVAYPFGNLARMRLGDRDGKDTGFEQLIMDYWASFARSGDPNPEKGWLEARGYWLTKQRVEEAGKWEKVKARKMREMLMQWDGGMMDFGEEERKQCEVLGLGLNYYETAR
jgi:carboxylesterase type B